MRQSVLFTKTRKFSPQGEVSKNSQLLIKAGFIYKEMAGVYDLLPLGLEVIKKITAIIRAEMNAIGGQEVRMSSLQNPAIWKKTNRWDEKKVPIWFKTKLVTEKVAGLSWSHEEPMTQMVKEFIHSYQDLPIYIYQFQRKFRNELRSKSGILRGREFLMKDLYSFNKTEKDLDKFYEAVKKAYLKIFNQVGIGKTTYFTFASGGAFAKYSHEFQTICSSGEDTIYLDEKRKIAINKEVYNDTVLKDLGLQSKNLKKTKAIEVANIFKLGTRYSTPLNLLFTDKNGHLHPVVMGSYGIGIGRLMGTIVEVYHDEKGIIWPKTIAPYQIHLLGLDLNNKEVWERAFRVYRILTEKNIPVLFDDRIRVRAGEKFADADLIGIPIRIVVSKKTGEKLEVKLRKSNQKNILSLNEVLNKF